MRAYLDVEPGETVAEILREDVSSSTSPLPQLDESRTRGLSHPQQSIEPMRHPAGKHQNQGVKEKKGDKFEEQDQHPEAEAKKKYKSVHLDFSQRLFFRSLGLNKNFLASDCT